MPGGRLTNDDRRQIAEWVADGLAYAEIARRLERPTSTISREVARNAAPSGGYLAEVAQESAGLRARRRKAPRLVEDVTGGRPGRETEEMRAFVDEFAALLAATGMPRMTARVFVCLLTADVSGLTSAELVERLRVSPASVSKSIAALEAMELVVRRSDPGGRRERYVIEDDVWLQAWQADTGAHAEIATAAQRGIAIFGAESTAGIRLDGMGRFFARLSEHMGGSGLADAVVHDALSVLAGLVQAGRPLTEDALAAGLDWPRERITAAVEALRAEPAIADPFALNAVEAGKYGVVARPDRLSPRQCAALAQG